MLERVIRLFHWSWEAAWALMMLLLPITSLPLLARLVGSDMVAAPAAFGLVWLVLLWFVPYLVRGGKLHPQAIPFLAFVSVAFISSAAAFFVNVPSLKDRSLISREIQAVVTLGVGACFYFVVSLYPNSSTRLKTALRWINVGGFIILAWSFIQAYYTYTSGNYAPILSDIQHMLSERGLFSGRVTGLAFEPSWLAHQLNMLYLPLWLAATVQGYSSYRFRLWRITIENILLVGGVVVLFLSFSRVGLLGFLLGIAYLFLVLNGYLIKVIRARLTKVNLRRPQMQRLVRALSSGLLIVIFLVVYVSMAFGVVYGASRYDARLANLFKKPDQIANVFQYANQLSFAERMVYWAAGWNIFGEHPIIGVGLGNAGFYFQNKFPNYAWSLVEINLLMDHSNYLPNTKALWVRLLTETGLVGFAMFVAFLYTIWQTGRYLRSGKNRLYKTLGLAGNLILIAMLTEGFSVDSFALPYWWITFGLVSAAGRLMVHEEKNRETTPNLANS